MRPRWYQPRLTADSHLSLHVSVHWDQENGKFRVAWAVVDLELTSEEGIIEMESAKATADHSTYVILETIHDVVERFHREYIEPFP